MIIFGIDPGLSLTGYSIIEYKDNSLTLLKSGIIKTSKEDNLNKRQLYIYNKIFNLLIENKVDILSLEKLFFLKNRKTAMQISEIRGIIKLAASQNNLKIVEYTPLEVKQNITGYGKATKREVQYAIMDYFNLDKLPRPDDKADAIAIGLNYILDNTLIYD